MRMKATLPILALALAACTTPYGDPYGGPYGGSPYPQDPQGYPQPYPSPYPAPYPTPYPGSQQPGLSEPYKAVGTEPFWSLTIDQREMRFETMNGLRYGEPTPPVQPGYAGDIFRGQRLEVNIVHQPCSDQMSDRIYPDRVQVYFDGRRWEGCGGPASIFQPGWENGQSPYYGDAAIPLDRTSWQIVAINGRQTPARDFYINFMPDGQLSAKFGCNNANGSYSQGGSTLTVGPMAMTRMACPEMSFETQASNIFGSPMQVSLRDDRLTLSNRAGTIEARRAY